MSLRVKHLKKPIIMLDQAQILETLSNKEVISETLTLFSELRSEIRVFLSDDKKREILKHMSFEEYKERYKNISDSNDKYKFYSDENLYCADIHKKDDFLNGKIINSFKYKRNYITSDIVAIKPLSDLLVKHFGFGVTMPQAIENIEMLKTFKEKYERLEISIRNKGAYMDKNAYYAKDLNLVKDYDLLIQTSFNELNTHINNMMVILYNL